MLEVSRSSRRKKSSFNFYLVGIVLFFVLVGSLVFANTKLNEFKEVNANLNNQLEELKAQENKLKDENTKLKNTKNDIENKINKLPKVNN